MVEIIQKEEIKQKISQLFQWRQVSSLQKQGNRDNWTVQQK